MAEFRGFIDYLDTFFNSGEALPGEEVQFLMAPQSRKSRAAVALQKSRPRKSAVLVLFYPDEKGMTNFPLILRPEYPGVHSGQVALPGGRLEEQDKNLRDTAFRETEEEIGVKKQAIIPLGELTHLYIPPSNYLVYPFIGYSREKPNFIPEEREVKEILETPVEVLLDPEIVKIRDIRHSTGVIENTPYFHIADKVVWGATAMILSELAHIVKKM